MIDLKLTAVGSSPLIAEEIKSIIQSFLGDNLFVETALTKNIVRGEKNNFYVCAKTQENFLKSKISPDNLFIFDLHPTTKFFLDIAQIPSGKSVCVFNNRLSYTKLLIEECHDLGITELKFFPIAYEEMDENEVAEGLKRADYIIGIECLTGEKMLLSKKYFPLLKTEIKIISGKRAASVMSAGKLLTSIADFYYNLFIAEKNILNDGQRENIRTLLTNIIRVVNMLKNAVNKAVTSQVDFNGSSDSSNEISTDSAKKSNLNLIDEQLKILFYLRQKIQSL